MKMTWERFVEVLSARWLVLLGIGLAIVVVAGVVVLDLDGRMPTSAPATPADPSTPASSDRGVVVPSAVDTRLLLPLVMRSAPSPPAIAEKMETPAPTLTPAPSPTPTPAPLDFAALRQELEAEGKALAHVKIGFHAGPGGNSRGLGDYMRGLAGAGVPAMIKSADAYGVCAEALEISPEHITVFRMTGGYLELPEYDLPPEVAAEVHWERVMRALPPEFDRRTWLEVMNEPDKARADWLGRCAHRLGELALQDGYRLAAFGWSSGEPEPEDWTTPGMLAFLRLAAQHPDRLAVALHEYSYDVDDIDNLYPSLIGRFQKLFEVCDARGLDRPTVLITEWGWEYQQVPSVGQAMEDIAWATRLYGAYPEVRGAAIWYLGSGFGGVADRAQRLILPVWMYAWSEYFVVDPDVRGVDVERFRRE
ncbi:MAG: hypothetical protein ACOC7Y_02085 [Chloroflexota bacterium]